MSDEILDDDEFDGESGSSLVKDLRKQLKAAKKAADEAAAKAAQYEALERRKTVSDRLAAAGARPELAKFYTGEDSSPETVDAWIKENAELFGVADLGVVDADTAANAAAISRATAGAPQQKIGSREDIAERIRNAKTPEELRAAYAAAAGV